MLTVHEYRAEASEICRRSKEKESGESSEGDLIAALLLEERVARETYESFACLVPPSEFAHLHSKLLNLFEAGLECWPPLIEAAGEGLLELLVATADQKGRTQALQVETKALCLSLGIPDCE